MRVGITLMLTCILATRLAWADPDLDAIRLVYSAPDYCPSGDQFEREVRRAAPRLRVTFSDDTRLRLFTVDLDGGIGPRGRLTIAKDGVIVGSRDAVGANCTEVASVLAFAVALAVDPNATIPAAVPIPPPTPASPAPAATDRESGHTLHPLPEGASGFRERWWALSMRGLAATGFSPSLAFGGGPSVDVGGRIGILAPAARLGLEYSASAPAAADGARVTFANSLVSLEGCPAAWELGSLWVRPCVRVDGGARVIAGEDIPAARTRVRPWLDMGPAAHIRQRIAGAMFVDLGGAALFTVFQDRVFFEGGASSPSITVHQAPSIAVRGEVAVGVEFR